MGQPINYTGGFVNPLESLTQGLKVGEGIGALQQRQQLTDLKVREEERAIQQQQRAQEESDKFFANPNKSQSDIIRYASYQDPKMVAALGDQFKGLSSEAQQKTLTFAGQVFSGLQSSTPKISADLLKQRAEVEPDPQTKQAYLSVAEIAESDPKRAERMLAPMIAVLPGGDKVLKAAYDAQMQPDVAAEVKSKAGSAASDAAIKASEVKYADVNAKSRSDELKGKLLQQKAELGLTNAQTNKAIAEARRVKAEMEATVSQDPTIPPTVIKEINENIDKSITDKATAAGALSLANDFDKMTNAGGAPTKIGRWLRKSMGTEKNVDAFLNKAEGYRNKLISKELEGKSPVTDTDVVTFSKGIPEPTADPKFVASWLRGLNKTMMMSSNQNRAMGEWKSKSGGVLTEANRDMVIAGIPVKKGQNVTDVVSSMNDKILSQTAAPAAPAAPAIGTVKKGYRFKGGNPSIPDSWEKI